MSAEYPEYWHRLRTTMSPSLSAGQPIVVERVEWAARRWERTFRSEPPFGALHHFFGRLYSNSPGRIMRMASTWASNSGRCT